ncbi:MAG: protein-disulfide reductase DsbD N-terminal domain-containing protein [Blastocatellia bacterium]
MKFVVLLLFIFGFFTSAYPQASTTNPVRWSLKLVPVRKSYNKPFQARLSARIAGGWYLYALEEIPNGPRPTRISLAAKQPFVLAGEIQSPLPQSKFDENFGVETQFYEKAATFFIPIKIQAGALGKVKRLQVQVRYQSCNDHLCLPPKTVTVTTSQRIH